MVQIAVLFIQQILCHCPHPFTNLGLQRNSLDITTLRRTYLQLCSRLLAYLYDSRLLAFFPAFLQQHIVIQNVCVI